MVNVIVVYVTLVYVRVVNVAVVYVTLVYVTVVNVTEIDFERTFVITFSALSLL